MVELKTFWLVVLNEETGQFHNAQVTAVTNSLEAAAIRFYEKFPQYRVLDGGAGIENRPKEVRALPYI
ncbi:MULTISPECIES: hypothetical protein [Bacillus]|uniref:hypothetical protein n=1 Tax=Bacillus TaxID=1386 RepID=UPI000C76FFA7|nr:MULTISPECIES: hypothetical protein [Bacillus]MCP1161387.1 hypothetical protein [Bacillus infantis]PLR70481.1 hypothetical protein CYJ37_23395 [Bacillus sp. UMB0728]